LHKRRQNGLTSKLARVLFVVVVNQGGGAGEVAVAVVLVVFDKLVPNHVSHGQGAAVAALFAAHLIEPFVCHLRDRDGEPDDAFGLCAFHELNGSEGT